MAAKSPLWVRLAGGPETKAEWDAERNGGGARVARQIRAVKRAEREAKATARDSKKGFWSW